MAKSKYPQQIDTSIEIPAVRNNILEVGSEVIDSLRSAIFNIEKTLGINPQGAVGNSVAERLSKALDANGNIKPDAISKANFLTGPIIDSDVSRVAGIQEDKLKLDFPTRLLQSEISVLNSSIDSIVSQIEDLSLNFSVHINKNSLNRHPATAISTEEYTPTTSDLAAAKISSGNVQTALQDIYNSHINYTGLNISADNKSHSANQIYFDNSNVSLYINSSNTQGALEEVTNKAYNIDVTHQDIMHSNGILRTGYINTATNPNYGNILAQDVSASFVAATQSNLYTMNIIINDSVSTLNLGLEKSDILSLYNNENPAAAYTGDYEIINFTETAGLLTSVTILANIYINSDSQTLCRITKRLRTDSSITSLLISAREEPGLTASRSIQVCHPNACRAISSGIRPLELSASNKYIGVSIDNGPVAIIDLLYNGNTFKSLDTIVGNINKQCSENAYNFYAYRLDNENSPSELVIACNIADSDLKQYTIKITRENDNGIDPAGFSYVEDVELKSVYNSNYFISGKSYSDLGVKVDTQLLSFVAGSSVVNSSISGINFVTAGVKKFDQLVITNSVSDNKTFLITDVASDSLTLSSYQLPSGFSSDSVEDTQFIIYKNIISFENITFDEVSSSTGSSLHDIYMDKNKDLFYSKRFEYKSEVSGLESKITLIDFQGDIGTSQYSLDIVVDPSDGHLTLTLDSGPNIDVYGKNNYIWVSSGLENIRLKFHIPDVSYFSTDINIVFYSFPSSNNLTNLLVSRVPFDNYVARVVGGNKSGAAVYKLSRGLIGENDISSQAVTNLLEIPRSELRSNGVIAGLEVSNATIVSGFYSFDLQPGICYINGKRFEISGINNFITNITAGISISRIYIGLDFFGNITIEPSTISCASPFENSSVCTLASIDYSSPDVLTSDLRLFIDRLDLKVLNAITVSPQPGMGHFTDVGKAIKYARKFSELYPKAGVPSIHLKSGKHYITVEVDESALTFASWIALSPSSIVEKQVNKCYESGLVLDFPINISGEGDSSELIFRFKYVYSDITNIYKGSFITIGDGYSGSTYASKITSGVITISNLKMNNSKITLYDMSISSGASKYPFSFNIDNVTFDNQNFDTPNSIDNLLPLLSISLLEVYNTSTNKGNLSINNCRFIPEKTAAFGNAISVSNATRTKNISITNNKLYNTVNGTSLLNLDIVSNTNADSGSNILLLGNMAYGTTLSSDASRAKIHTTSGSWSDRISKDLYVSQNISVGNEFSYSTEKTFSQLYIMNQLNTTSEFLTSSSASITQATMTTGDTLYTFQATRVVSPTGSSFSIPLNRIPIGATIKEVEIGMSKSATTTITIDIENLTDSFSGKTTLSTDTGTTPGLFLAGTTIYPLLIQNVNLDTTGRDILFAKISHNNVSTVYFYYLRVIFKFNNISEALGCS